MCAFVRDPIEHNRADSKLANLRYCRAKAIPGSFAGGWTVNLSPRGMNLEHCCPKLTKEAGGKEIGYLEWRAQSWYLRLAMKDFSKNHEAVLSGPYRKIETSEEI